MKPLGLIRPITSTRKADRTRPHKSAGTPRTYRARRTAGHAGGRLSVRCCLPPLLPCSRHPPGRRDLDRRFVSCVLFEVSVFVVVVVWSWLLAACGPSRRRPFRVEQSRREPAVARLVCVETAAGLCAVTPVLAGVVDHSLVLDRQRRQGRTVRPSGNAIGAERRRVENPRQRPAAVASPRTSYGAGVACTAP